MAIESATAIVPAVDKPVEKMTTAELLQDTVHHGLRRMREIVLWDVGDGDLNKARLVSETAGKAMAIMARIEEAGFRASVTQNAVAELGDRLRAVEKSQMKAAKRAAAKASGSK